MRKVKKRRATPTRDHQVKLDESRLRAILKETFDGKSVECDFTSLLKDLNFFLIEDTGAAATLNKVKKEQEAIRRRLSFDENERRFFGPLVSAAGRHHFHRAKKNAATAGGMKSYDAEIQALGFPHYDDFINAKIEEFLKSSDLFLNWMEESGSRPFDYLETPSMNQVITCRLPDIFKKHFPMESQGNSPTSARTRFVASVLKQSGMYPAVHDAEPHAMIVKRSQDKEGSCRADLDAKPWPERPYPRSASIGATSKAPAPSRRSRRAVRGSGK